MAKKMPEDPAGPKVVTIASQIKLIQIVSLSQIGVAILIVLSQTLAIAVSNEFATRSLTGIWTSWFFFMAAGFTLFWSSKCTFNGLLAVLVLNIIAATIAIPLLTACFILLGVYNFVWDVDEEGAALVGSSITLMTTNLIMIFTSMVEMGLNAFNAYNCYFLAYGGQPKDNNYDQTSIKSSMSTEANENDVPAEETKSSDPAMPPPPPDLTLAPTDILIIKYCGMTGVLLAVIIFCAQTSMLALGRNDGIRVGVGIWGAVFYAATGVVTVYNGWKPSSQGTVAIFILQIVQLIISIPMVGIGYYVVAVFGSCIQHSPLPDCVNTGIGETITITIMAAIMALSGMVQGLLSQILILICAQAVCGIRCMVSGATVYPML